MSFVNPLHADRTSCRRFLHAELLDPSARQLIKKVVRLAGDCRRKKVLDIGCGPGVVLSHIIKKGGIGYGLDHSKTMLDIAKDYCANLILADIESFETCQKFDIILCIEFLEHIRRDEEILKKICRMLEDDGFLIITTPHKSPLREDMRIGGHIRHYSLKELEEKLNRSGLRIVRSQCSIPFLSKLWPSIKKSWMVRKLSYSSKLYRWVFMPFGDMLFETDNLLNLLNRGTNREGQLILKAEKELKTWISES